MFFIDWEEMMDESRLDLYPLDYDDANHTGTNLQNLIYISRVCLFL